MRNGSRSCFFVTFGSFRPASLEITPQDAASGGDVLWEIGEEVAFAGLLLPCR
jgi:hypothetical protein